MVIKEGRHATRFSIWTQNKEIVVMYRPRDTSALFNLSFLSSLVKTSNSEWQHNMNALSAAEEAQKRVFQSQGLFKEIFLA